MCAAPAACTNSVRVPMGWASCGRPRMSEAHNENGASDHRRSWPLRALVFTGCVLFVIVLQIALYYGLPFLLLAAMAAAVVLTPVIVLVLAFCLVFNVIEPYPRKPKPMVSCPSCSYSTAGLNTIGGICPECGCVWERSAIADGSEA